MPDGELKVGGIVLLRAVDGTSQAHKPSHTITSTLPKNALFGRNQDIIGYSPHITIAVLNVALAHLAVVPVLPDDVLAEIVLLPRRVLILIDADDFQLPLRLLVCRSHLWLSHTAGTASQTPEIE